MFKKLDNLLTTRTIHISMIWFTLIFVSLSFTNAFQEQILRWPAADTTIIERDTDIWLRLNQVKQLINSPDFFNHKIENTNAPYDGVATHWTRPADLLLKLGYELTPNDLPIQQRLMLSATWVPVILGILSILLLIKCAALNFKNPYKTGLVIFCFPINKFAYFHFYPGNADHHNLQLFLFCTYIYFLMSDKNKTNSLGLGISIGLSLWVSIEFFALLIPTLGFLCLKTYFKNEKFTHIHLSIIASIITTLIALFVENRPQDILSQIKYDTLSFAYCTVLFFAAFATLSLDYANTRFKTLSAKILSLILITSASLLSLYLLFPKLFQGPLVELDSEYLKDTFFKFIPEATPLLNHAPDTIYQILIFPALALLLARRAIEKTPELFILLITSLALVLAQMRWFYYLETISILLIAIHLPTYLKYLTQKYCPRIQLLAAPYLTLALIITPIYFITPAPYSNANIGKQNLDGSCIDNIFFNIQTGKLQEKIGNTPAIIESNSTQTAGPLLFFTPYKVVTSQLHRELETIKIYNQLFTTTSEDIAEGIIRSRKIDYLIICPEKNTWLEKYTVANPELKNSSLIGSVINLETPPAHKMSQAPLLLKIKKEQGL